MSDDHDYGKLQFEAAKKTLGFGRVFVLNIATDRTSQAIISFLTKVMMVVITLVMLIIMINIMLRI